MIAETDEKGKKKIWAFLPAIFLMALIFYFSAQPSEESSEVSELLGVRLFAAANGLFGLGWSMQKIASLSVETQHTIRKAAHFTEFAVLGMLLFHGFRVDLRPVGQDFAHAVPAGSPSTPASARSAAAQQVHGPGRSRILLRAAALSFLCAALYAASDEIHQLFIPGRSGMVRDVLIDCAGALTGVLIVLLPRSLAAYFPRRSGTGQRTNRKKE